MKRTSLLAMLAIAVLAIAACGGDSDTADVGSITTAEIV